MNRACKHRLCRTCIRAVLVDTEIDLARAAQPHEPLITRLVVRHLERAAADADDAVRRIVVLRAELNAALDLLMVNVHAADIDVVVLAEDMDAVDVRRALRTQPKLCPVVIEIGIRLYRERTVEVQRRLPRRPDAAHLLLACPQLFDFHIRIDG